MGPADRGALVGSRGNSHDARTNNRFGIEDEFTDDGIWDQATVRRCHMTVKGIDVVDTVSLPADRRSRAPQPSCQFD